MNFKKIISAILCICMALSLAITVVAEETFLLTPGDGITVYVNGNKITQATEISGDDRIKLTVDDENVVAVTAQGRFYDVGKVIKLSEATDFTEATAYALGLEMVNGAQVRVGEVVLNDGKITSGEDSGLRFLAICDYADTVISENVEFGIKVTAEGSESSAYIKAEKFQNEDKTVFSAAITNLHESNYNRKYTACAYAIIPLHDGTEKEVTSEGVTRSIYQVSAGILKNSSAEAEDSLDYTVDEVVKEVLCAYVNQTGIRLTYSPEGVMTARTEGKGAYTGDLYFDVASRVNPSGSTSVTITPLDSTDGFFNPVSIPTWWKDYVRINNNHSVITEYISNVELKDGILSFDFAVPDTTEYTFDQDDNVTVVAEVSKDEIKGFKAGEEVTYSVSETITLMGLAESYDDIVPGCVILTAENSEGDVAAIELLASIGMPVNPEVFEGSVGVYLPSDGSEGYQNIVTELYSKSGTKITCQSLPDTTKTTYRFLSSNTPCYRVGIAMDGETPIITTTNGKASTYPSVFGATSEYHNYLYLRLDTEADRITECVFYRVPKDLDFTGDGEYSDIFSLDDYRVIIN